MASSPLTMAMLGGGAGANSPYGMAMYDPQTMAAMQRLGFAQNLASEGLSSAPAYPMQALSRLGQAILGGYMLKQGYGDLEQLGQQRQQEGAASDSFVYGAHPQAAPTTATPVSLSSPLPAQPNVAPQGAAQPPSGGGTDYASLYGDPNSPDWAKANLTTVAAPSGANFIVNNKAAAAFKGFLGDLEAAGYKVNPGESGGYNLRNVTGGTTLSPHAYGAAIDINSSANPYSKTPDGGALQTNLPPNVGDMAAKWGLQWGGNWKSLKDPMHFEYVGQKPAQYAQAGNIATDAAPGATQPQGAPQQVAQAGPQPQPQGAPQQPGSPQVGLDNRDVQHALEIQRLAASIRAQHPNPMDPMNIRAQAYDKYADHLLSIGQYQTNSNGTQLNKVSGKIENAAEPLAHYVPTPTGSVDTTGTHPPTFMPSPRVAQTPAGSVLAVGPGGQITPIAPADNPGVAARAASTAQGEATGKQAVVTSDRMYDLGREADQAIGNIDYGVNQLHEAAKGGIPSGYFAPWLATAAAAGKSLGIDLKGLGVDPAAVGKVQSAQKTLGVVAGTILQNTIGKDSQITDAKIEHFIHTQPGIETDPQAIERIMNWARSQFTYNREMAMDAMQHSDPVTGMLPPGWRASFVKQKGAFAPIYDPLSQEMKQPQGQGPAAEMPKAPTPQQQTQAPAQPSRADIEAEMRRRGLLK